MSDLRTSCLALVIGALSAACGGSGSSPAAPSPTPAPGGTDTPSGPTPAPGTVTFQGTVATATQNGTIEITVPAGGTAAGTADSRPRATVDASGTIRLDSGDGASMTGTYEDVTGQVVLTGGGYRAEGTIPPSARRDAETTIDGTVSTPGGPGIFSTMSTTGGPVTKYCGTYRIVSGDSAGDRGIWTFSVAADGRVVGSGNGDGGPFRLTGRSEGSRVTFTVSGEGSCTVSVQNGTVGGRCSATSVSGRVCQ